MLCFFFSPLRLPLLDSESMGCMQDPERTPLNVNDFMPEVQTYRKTQMNEEDLYKYAQRPLGGFPTVGSGVMISWTALKEINFTGQIDYFRKDTVFDPAVRQSNKSNCVRANYHAYAHVWCFECRVKSSWLPARPWVVHSQTLEPVLSTSRGSIRRIGFQR